jgi:hypothetical protein
VRFLVLLPSLYHALNTVWSITIGCDLTLEYTMAFADQWNAQATVMRINESLIERGYVTWFDLTNMKGELQLLPPLLLSTAADRRYAYWL